MKKTFFVVFLLMFGLVVQVQAASTSANQGTKAGQIVSRAQGNQEAENTVQTNEQNKVKNQGESNQIQAQEQNAVQIQDSVQSKTSNGKPSSDITPNSNPSNQKRSEVAKAVQAMLQVAERNGGIGQQVRTIAQNQAKLEQNIANIQSRGGFAKFFIGPNYGEITDAQKTLKQNREQIRQLNQIRTQLTNEGDQQQLIEQTKVLEQSNQKIETSLVNAQRGFSLFGWLNKLVS